MLAAFLVRDVDIDSARLDHVDGVVELAYLEQVVVCVDHSRLHVLAHFEYDLLVKVAKDFDAAYEVDESRRQVVVVLGVGGLGVEQELGQLAASVLRLGRIVWQVEDLLGQDLVDLARLFGRSCRNRTFDLNRILKLVEICPAKKGKI